jgi:hypothetical protein
MAITELVFRTTPAQIGSIVLDAAVREVHSARAKATRHPIEAEEGSPSTVSDHVITEPLSITIDGVISGHPAVVASQIVSFFSGGGKDPVRDAHQVMLDDLLTGRLVTVFTNLLEYPNMVLEDVTVTREAASGNNLNFRAVAAQVTLVQLETIDVQVKAPTRSRKNGGKKPKKQVPSGPKRSALDKLFFGS